MTTNLTQASHQWATRPADERFWTLDDMHRQTVLHRRASQELEQPLSQCRLVSTDRGVEMVLAGQERTARVGHFAFTQVCRKLNAPASYMRTLPSDLAVECLENSRGHADARGDRILLLDHTDQSSPRLRATTSSKYFRVWNHEIVEGLLGLREQGWVVPPARPTGIEGEQTRIATEDDVIDFGDSPLSVKVGDTIAPAGLYASDHDMFAFMIHPEVVIDNGVSPAGMRRGTMVRQSEVGSCSIWKLDFLFDTVCGNHIVWDAREIRETRVRHMGTSVEENWVAMIRSIGENLQESASEQEAAIKKAQQFIIGEGRDEIINALFRGRWTSKRVAGAAYDLAVEHESVHGNPNSMWGMVSGLTRLSQETTYADERTAMDRAAGKMLAAIA